jgi:Transcriptional regulatory protein, C terminal
VTTTPRRKAARICLRHLKVDLDRGFDIDRTLPVIAARGCGHGSVVSSQTQILQCIWDENLGGADKDVAVYIGYLRRTIDVPFGTNTIETARGGWLPLGVGQLGQRQLNRHHWACCSDNSPK